MNNSVEVFGNVVDGDTRGLFLPQDDSLNWREVKGGVHYGPFAHDPHDPQHLYIDGGPICAACGLYGYNTPGNQLVFAGMYISRTVRLRNPSYRLCDFHSRWRTAPLPEKTTVGINLQGDA